MGWMAAWRSAYRAAQCKVLEVDPETRIPRLYGPNPPLLFFRTYCAAGGLLLHPLMWRQDEETRAFVQTFIERGLEDGVDMMRKASAALYSGELNDYLAPVYGKHYPDGGGPPDLVRSLHREYLRPMRETSRLRVMLNL